MINIFPNYNITLFIWHIMNISFVRQFCARTKKILYFFVIYAWNKILFIWNIYTCIYIAQIIVKKYLLYYFIKILLQLLSICNNFNYIYITQLILYFIFKYEILIRVIWNTKYATIMVYTHKFGIVIW